MIIFHIDNELHYTIEEYFYSFHSLYYSTEQLLVMIDYQYIILFSDIFDIDNYYNEYYNLYYKY